MITMPRQKYLEVYIRYHRWWYYEASQPTIDDEIFDLSYDELERDYPDSPVLSEVGCTSGSPGPPDPEPARSLNG